MLEQRIISSRGERQWQGIPTIARTKGGRLYVAWGTGGPVEPDKDNYIMLSHSDDDGQTWSAAAPFIVPEDGDRAFDVCLWTAPDGAIWCFYNFANLERRVYDIYVICCANPDADQPTWSYPRLIDIGAPFAFRSLKPIVTSWGEWMLPVTWCFKCRDWFNIGTELEGVAISGDQGRTWELFGAVKLPSWSLENCIVENLDHSLTMYSRSEPGCLWKTTSPDRGRNWSLPERTAIINPGCRYDIQRLSTGELLLINEFHVNLRANLRASISRDDGQSFSSGLAIDDRSGNAFRDNGVSYPQFVEGDNGRIFMVNDFDRQGAGEIIFSSFLTSDVN